MNVRARTKPDRQFHIDVEFGLFVILLGLIFLLRITNITYNTLFVDEAIYATVGQEVLANIYTQVASAWMFGSYLYPYIAGIVDQLASTIGLRVLSALLSSLAAIFVFSATRRLFGKQAALWAMLIFGLTGASISLGQYAVIDTLSMPLLALALYCLMVAASATAKKESFYLLAASIAFVLSVLAKYIAIPYFPALLLIVVLLYRQQGRPITPLLTKFVLPAFIILGVYASYYHADLYDLINSNYSSQPMERGFILKNIWEEIGVVILIALAGLVLLLRGYARLHPQRKTIFYSILIGLICMAIFLAVPIYHIVSGNFRALSKHVVFSLIFLAPLAGYALASITWQSRLRQGRWTLPYRTVGAAIIITILVWFANNALDRNWGFQHSWPEVSTVVDYMRSRGLSQADHVLAAGSAIYEYYFDFGPKGHEVWDSTWYLKYKDLFGIDAMAAAIQDHQFKFVVLDNYYTPQVNERLEAALATAGYTLGFENSQNLGGDGPITIRVYVLAQ